MPDYATKSYGRKQDVDAIYKLFAADRDVSMPGPRRLGKTFLLDRIVDAGEQQKWIAVKIEVAGCSDTQSFFRALCSKIGSKRSGGKMATDWVLQRLGQAVNPRNENAGPWYQAFLSLDHQTYFERLIKALHDDKVRRWALLIDELPIFLKALHDKGPLGIAAARDFMNLTSRLRADYPRVRWMVTGSIGLEPLAQAGNYMGVLAKFHTYELEPLSEQQAKDFITDLALTGRLLHRKSITDTEAQALVSAVGWRSAYYLEALAQKLVGQPCRDVIQAQTLAEDAVGRLLQPNESPTFGVWEEHLRKHWDTDRATAFAVLAALAATPLGLSVNTLLPKVGDANLSTARLRAVLIRLHIEGFVTVNDLDHDNPTAAFRNPLLRRWWQRFNPHATT